MRRFACAEWLSAFVPLMLALLASAGCADNSMVLKGQLTQLETEQLAIRRTAEQIQSRAEALDRDNQELETLLAQSRQQAKMSEERLAAVQDQLRDITTQLAESQDENRSSVNKVQALTASMRRRGNVSIKPNSSLLQALPKIDLPEVYVRRDGDVIRIELPASRLFMAGSVQPLPEAAGLITQVAAEVLRTYPDQMIGVEGHTDSDPISSARWRNNHELSAARATVVHGVLLGQAHFKPRQLFIVGRGANRPVASNATLEGKRRNRRVELVVYSEKHG